MFTALCTSVVVGGWQLGGGPTTGMQTLVVGMSGGCKEGSPPVATHAAAWVGNCQHEVHVDRWGRGERLLIWARSSQQFGDYAVRTWACMVGRVDPFGL
jgi:hypothetical protein